MTDDSTTSVRMYNVGFGDAFLVTVHRSNRVWRMLIDCGVHSQGQARPIKTIVRAIIDDLKRASGDGTPRLDVIVATHHHADHISGFSLPDWQEVVVGEVWLPFVEDQTDPDAQALRLTETAQRLLWHLDQRTHGLAADHWPDTLSDAQAFALNSFGNAEATDRLTGTLPQPFANRPTVRYLPYQDESRNTIAVGIADVIVHVLGPSRDPAQLKRMNPPTGAGWLRLDLDEPDDGQLSDLPLFKDAYIVADPASLPPPLLEAQRDIRLDDLTNDVGLLAAASILERAVNNTSLFLVLDVAGTKLVFPGDAQQGAWEHILDDPTKKALLADAAFYKIGHHGSHNATPKEFVTHIWHEKAHAMLPWGLVPQWKKTIPKQELLEELQARHHTVVRADHPQATPPQITVHEDLWSQIEFVNTPPDALSPPR